MNLLYLQVFYINFNVMFESSKLCSIQCGKQKKIIKKKNILIVLKGTVHVKLWNKFQFFFSFLGNFFSSVFNFTILVKGVGSLKNS